MAEKFKYDPQWAEAKKRCRLNREDIRKAKELGLSPRALLKNIRSKTQQWKLPVNLWMRELYGKRFGRGQRIAADRRSTAKSVESMAPWQAHAPKVEISNRTDQLDDHIPF